MARARKIVVLGFALSVVLAVGCDSEEEAGPPPTTNGVNDIAKACAIRAQWTRATASDCFGCLGSSTTPRCECLNKEYSGRCNEQQKAKDAEPACQGVGECVFKCASGDCACVDACYANKDACRPLGASLDGCLAEVCAPYCN